MTQHSHQPCPNCSGPMTPMDKNNPVCLNDISTLKEVMNELDPDGTVRYQATVMAAAEAADNLNRAHRLIDQMNNDTRPRSKRNRRRALQLLHQAQDAARFGQAIILLRPGDQDFPYGASTVPKSLEAIISENNRN